MALSTGQAVYCCYGSLSLFPFVEGFCAFPVAQARYLGLLAPNFLDDLVTELDLLPLFLFGQFVAVVSRGETARRSESVTVPTNA
jgi:hypothetical protein